MNWKKLKENPLYWRVFEQRARLLKSVREFFFQNGFLEIETPNLSPCLIPESYLEVFSTQAKNKLGDSVPAFFTPSPELWHKKLLASGSGNIFEITKSYRNTDMGGSLHNQEFTLLEWYRVNANCQDTMKDCEELIRFLHPLPSLLYQGQSISLVDDFECLSVINAFKKYAQLDEEVLFNEELLKNAAVSKNYSLSSDDNWEDVYNYIYVKEIEPHLGFGRPTFIYDFPSQFAPLAKTSLTDPRIRERFELYIAGVELADAYNELTDPVEQKHRFDLENLARQKFGKTDIVVDYDFISALESGLPDCSGVALGVDRLVMILTNQTNISNVILFSGADIFGQLC